jgi:hypothetical protein
MSDPVDPFELLRELNPVDPEDVADAASTVQARRALEEIIAGRRPPMARTPRRPRIRRLRRRSYLLALVPIAGAITAASWALTQGATKQLTIGCYASANLQAHTVVIPAGSDPPVDACRAVWQRDDFGNQPTPRLQACILPSGAIGVFPSATEAACSQLKLAPLTAATVPPSQVAASPLALKNALVRKFLTDRCMNEQRASATVQAELRRLRLTNWHVQTNGTFSSSRPCASLAFDEEQHRVLLVPMPKQP